MQTRKWHVYAPQQQQQQQLLSAAEQR
ncbi:uncharacterized protein CPUR_08114 [Claviceps purpurea 20.1]|uniref:Uncharacterized protein n=1 Tax=Claviceps purpurea (strain 20.1) TaxID=1111077 RepID=M1VYM1_CLAP2|nr:uncharacterized protein CPUR_08114 [Claviceps purpurea 20.1]